MLANRSFGDGAVIIGRSAEAFRRGVDTRSVLVRVEDADRHHDHARDHGATILQPPTDFP